MFADSKIKKKRRELKLENEEDSSLNQLKQSSNDVSKSSRD